jgi:hypothetical protein
VPAQAVVLRESRQKKAFFLFLFFLPFHPSHRLRSTMTGADEGYSAKTETCPHARMNLWVGGGWWEGDRKRDERRHKSKKKSQGDGLPDGIRVEDKVVGHV